MIFDFDKYSMILDNKPIMIRSAALHYFRLPGVEMWRDRLSKLKNAGYNTVDLYFSWSYHSKEQGVYDFTGIKDIRTLLDLTEELGLFVIARPGPYINAELSAGGLPLWLHKIPDIVIRNREDGTFKYSPAYMRAVREWYSRIVPIINEFQNVIAFQIENEYSSNEGEPDYIQELYDLTRELGVKVPIFHNDSYGACLYSDIVDIYGFDAYPTINLDHPWKENPYAFGSLDYCEENLKPCMPDSPLYVAELQSGWFDKWQGKGYEYIRKFFDRDHINIVTKTILANGITMFNHFMGCGGTSWGNLASAEVYTSYDFAAPIGENSLPGENYYQAKEINYFLHSFNPASTDLICQDADILGAEEENIFARLRFDNINGCKWLFLRNLNKENRLLKILKDFDINIKPFDMKILPIDLTLYGCKINFSSASLLGKLCTQDREVIFVIAEDNTELIISDFEDADTDQELSIDQNGGEFRIKLNDLEKNKLLKADFSRNDKTTQFIFISRETADKTWLFENKAIIGPDFVFDDPYKAAFKDNQETLSFNILNNEWKKQSIQYTETPQNLQTLQWKAFNAAPEIELNYDYSSWNLIEGKPDCVTNSIYDEFIWYKGNFKGVINQIEINAKHCYCIYINGERVFSHASIHYEYGKEIEETLTVQVNHDIQSKDVNEITMLVENLGFDKGFENYTALPRGIINFKTSSQKDIEWRIRGGLTPELEEWDYIPVNNLENASNNSNIVYLTAEFEHNSSDNTYSPLCIKLNDFSPEKANIYLNGKLIGRWWKSYSPDSKFYLPEGFVKSQNRISIVIWQLEPYQKIGDYKSLINNVNINIENISSFKVCELTDFI